ncbi:MAG: DUF1802 family protein [Cyanobacteria bacterium P01_D01_bin.105]
MSTSALSTALCLPALDIEALLQGRTIAAISDTFRNPARFLLLPTDLPLQPGQLEARYQAQFLSSFKATYTSVEDPDTVMIQAWARCGTCRIFSDRDDLAALSTLTAWTPAHLQQLVQEKHKIFLLFLKVHRFAEPLKLIMPRVTPDKMHTYIRVPGTWSDQGALSLLDDETFVKRQTQLIKLSPPQYPELQALQRALVFEREYSLGAMALDRDIRYFLGWSRPEETQLYDSDLSWIQQVAAAGLESDELEFKELVRRCLVKLGFGHTHQPHQTETRRTLEQSVTAENLGICYEAPYPVIAICQTSKDSSVSNLVAEQAIQLGNAPSGSASLTSTAKIIVAAGPLTEHAQKAAKGDEINVIRPKTLQKLTEMKARYPGSIDLLKLKTCLQSVPHGEAADEKVNQFIEEISQQIKIRAAVIQAVKLGLERTEQSRIGTNTVCTLYASLPDVSLPRLSVHEVKNILIELSSPVAGYLGCDHTDNGKALFYFLRELSVEDNNLITAAQ